MPKKQLTIFPNCHPLHYGQLRKCTNQCCENRLPPSANHQSPDHLQFQPLILKGNHGHQKDGIQKKKDIFGKTGKRGRKKTKKNSFLKKKNLSCLLCLKEGRGLFHHGLSLSILFTPEPKNPLHFSIINK